MTAAKKKATKKSGKKVGKKRPGAKPGKKTTKKKPAAKKAAKKSGTTTGPLFLQDLPIQLTEGERLKRGEAMTREMRNLDAMNGSFDFQRKEHNAKVKEKESEIAELRRAFEKKTEERRVQCQWKRDWTKGQKTLIRTDRKGRAAIVRTETIPADERQMDLTAAKAKNAKAGKKATSSKKPKSVGKPATQNDEKPLTASIGDRVKVAAKIEEAKGKALDALGKKFKVARGAMNDAKYRKAIEAAVKKEVTPPAAPKPPAAKPDSETKVP